MKNVLQPTRDLSGTFGSGALEPYANALRDPARSLSLHRMAPRPECADAAEPNSVDVRRYLAPADAVDIEVIRHCRGPILDVGCGPGRIVQAAVLAGHLALGIDISTTAVAIAQERGLPVLCRSLFQELPAEGTWGTVVVLDGNIGIGGDPMSLLQRCADLILDDGEGRILVEVHPDADRIQLYDGVVVDDLSQESLPFPWAEVGARTLHLYADDAGLTLLSQWKRGQRAFALYSL